MPEQKGFLARVSEAWGTLTGRSVPAQPAETPAATDTKSSPYNAPYAESWHWRGGGAHHKLPGTERDFRELAGDTWRNATAAICLQWIRNAILAAPLRTCRDKKTGQAKGEVEQEWIDLSRSPYGRLLNTPNKDYSATTLWAGTSLSYKTDGNAFWLLWPVGGLDAKTPDGAMVGETEIVELWYIPHFLISVGRNKQGERRYKYRRGRGEEWILTDKNIIHFRDGIDPRNPECGMSAFKSCVRSVVSDNEADTYITSLLLNMGVPGAYASPLNKEDTITNDNADLMKEKYKSFAGDNRGGLMVATVPIKLEKIAFNPEELMLDKMRDDPRIVICAALLGAGPMVVGLPDKNKTYANLGEAEKQAWENGILPMMRILADDLNKRKVELGSREYVDEYAAFDTSDVAALRDDELKKAQIVKTRAEAAAALVQVGYDPVETLNACELPEIPFIGLPEKDDTAAEGEDDTTGTEDS